MSAVARPKQALNMLDGEHGYTTRFIITEFLDHSSRMHIDYHVYPEASHTRVMRVDRLAYGFKITDVSGGERHFNTKGEPV